jgi:hypothetical protein
VEKASLTIGSVSQQKSWDRELSRRSVLGYEILFIAAHPL